jgi:outer membrane protein OmpA-like peptidoglycan-associated protein
MSRLRPFRAPLCVFALAAVAMALGTLPPPADAQVLDRLKRSAKNAAQRELASQVDRMVTDAIRCKLDDPRCVKQAEEQGKPVVFTDDDGEVIVDDNGNPIGDRTSAAAAAQGPGQGVWSNYDFVPGERVLFYEDYSADKVGDFPRLLAFLNGTMEIVDAKGTPWLRATGGSAFAVELGETLPERFTLEFPVLWSHGNQWMRVLFDVAEGQVVAPRRLGNYRSPHLQIDERNTGIFSFDRSAPQAVRPVTGKILNGPATIRLMADGRHVKAYVGETRVANVPQLEIGRAGKIWFIIADATEKNPMYVGAIRVAAGGGDLYDKLEAEGRVTTRGILFDIDSDRIRPESTPTLEEIGSMLRQHESLRLSIEGHTDASGDDAHNQALSERRAESVRRLLIEQYGIAADRLKAAGHGEAKPVTTNDTAEGRQSNRRVELVKLGDSD